MKNTCLSKLLGIGLLIAAAILPGYGQTTGQTSGVAVDIPFDFVVAGITLPLAWIIHEVSSQKRKDALKGMMNTGFRDPALPFGASIA
jgi:hypothetical protein